MIDIIILGKPIPLQRPRARRAVMTPNGPKIVCYDPQQQQKKISKKK